MGRFAPTWLADSKLHWEYNGLHLIADFSPNKNITLVEVHDDQHQIVKMVTSLPHYAIREVLRRTVPIHLYDASSVLLLEVGIEYDAKYAPQLFIGLEEMYWLGRTQEGISLALALLDEPVYDRQCVMVDWMLEHCCARLAEKIGDRTVPPPSADVPF